MLNQTELDELIDEFQDLDEREACELLDELGRQLPEIPQSVYSDENLVPGCQSRVWLVNQLTETTPPTMEIQVDSDAFVVKGLAYVVLQMYSARSPQEVLDVDYVRVFDRMGLGRLILPQRKNGLYSMVKRIREFAASVTGSDVSEEMIPGTAVISTNVETTRTIEGIAGEFPVLRQSLPNGQRPVFLDSGASAQKPDCVIEKQREVEEQYYANAFRGRYYFGQRVDDEIEATRTRVAALIGAQRTDEIVFTGGSTIAINMVATGLRNQVKAGDEVVVTEMEHHANFVPWQVLAAERGASFRILPIDARGRLDSNALDEMINDRTAIVAITSMSNVLGTVNPITEISKRAHSVGAKVVVDAAQSIPHAAMDVAQANIDFLVFSGHKLYGPSGVGVLYGKRTLLEQMDPMVYGGHMIESVGREKTTFALPPAKFEAGTPPIVPIIGLGAAIDFVNSIGYPAIHAHEKALLAAAHRRLSEIPGLTIYGPPMEDKGAIVSFTVDGVSTEDLAHRLDEKGVFTRHGHHCAMVLHAKLGVPATTRASFGVYNTLEDVESLARAIEFAIARLRR